MLHDVKFVCIQKFLKELNSSSLAEPHQLSKVLDFDCYAPAEFYGIKLSKLTKTQLCGIDPLYKDGALSEQDQYPVMDQDSLNNNPIARRRQHCKVQPSLMQFIPQTQQPPQKSPQDFKQAGIITLPMTVLAAAALGLVITILVVLLLRKRRIRNKRAVKDRSLTKEDVI